MEKITKLDILKCSTIVASGLLSNPQIINGFNYCTELPNILRDSIQQTINAANSAGFDINT